MPKPAPAVALGGGLHGFQMPGSSVKPVNFIPAPLGSTAEKSEDALDKSNSDSSPIATNIFEAQDTGFDPYAQSHKR